MRYWKKSEKSFVDEKRIAPAFSMHAYILLFVIGLLIFSGSGAVFGQQTTDEINNPEDLYTYAAGLAQRKFYDLALEQLQKFKERYPKHKYIREVDQLLIYCNHSLKHYDETERLMAEFKKNWPDSPMNVHFLQMRASGLFANGQFAKAAISYVQLQDSKDEVIAEEATYYLAQCYEKTGRLKEAYDLMSQLAEKEWNKKFPYRPYGAYYVVNTLLDQKKGEEALVYLKRLSDGIAVPAELKEEALARYAEVVYQLERYEEALRCNENYIVLYGDHPRAKIARRQRILCCYQLKQYTRVRSYYKDWHLNYLEENDVELDIVYAMSLSQLGAYEDALAIFITLGENKTNAVKTRQMCLLNAIDCLQYLKRDQDVIRRAENFIAEFPNYAEKAPLLYQMGYTSMHLERYQDAEKYLRLAMELFVGDAQNIYSTGILLVGVLEKESKYAEGAMVLRKLVDSDITDAVKAELLLRAARFECQLSKWDRARKDLNRLIDQYPKNKTAIQDALSILIDIDFSENDFEAARSHLELYLPMASESEKGVLSFRLAWAWSELENYTKAITVLKDSLASPNLVEEQRVTSMVLLIQILLFKKRIPELSKFVWELLKMPPTPALERELSGSFLLELAEEFVKVDNYKLAAQLWLRLIDDKKSDLDARAKGYLGLARIYLVLNQVDDAEKMLHVLSEEYAKARHPENKEQLSLLAEINLMKKKYSQALIYVDKSFKAEGGDSRSLARSYWVKASILLDDEKDIDGALPYCIKGYILCDDSVYSSKALSLAIRIFVQQNKMEDAVATWKELQRRYPVMALTQRSTPWIKKLISEEK